MKKLAVLFLPALLFAIGGASAAQDDWLEGAHYHAIQPAPARNDGDPIEVIEFFMYTCPHCLEFEPYVDKWLENKPADVEFKQMPALFGGPANLHARAYYALQLIGEQERLHDALFDTIHNKGQRLGTRGALARFLEQQDVDMEKFNAAMDSFAVQTKLNRANALMRRYGVRSVPTVVVDGRYRSGSGFHSYGEKVELIDDLVAKVRQERKSGAASEPGSPSDSPTR